MSMLYDSGDCLLPTAANFLFPLSDRRGEDVPNMRVFDSIRTLGLRSNSSLSPSIIFVLLKTMSSIRNQIDSMFASLARYGRYDSNCRGITRWYGSDRSDSSQCVDRRDVFRTCESGKISGLRSERISFH